MLKRRRAAKVVTVGSVAIGGNAPPSIQSMTNTDTKDVNRTVEQICALEREGAEIIRVAVPDRESAAALAAIKAQIKIPLVADIHFDYRLALEVLDKPIDKLRINPGNIGGEEKFSLVIAKARQKNIPVRLGINAGSLGSGVLKKWGGPKPEAMAEEAFNYVKIAENCSFTNLVISVKAADVVTSIKAYKLIAGKTGYPLHIGITEAGSFLRGTVKSAVGLGYLLLEGIGDTLRVSLTGNPTEEIQVAKDILQGVGIRQFGPEIISCPTCGRCGIDLISMVKEVEAKVAGIKRPIKIAVMGCAVNGPGEARQADYGIAGGKGSGLVFKKGIVIKKVPEEQLVGALLDMIAE